MGKMRMGAKFAPISLYLPGSKRSAFISYLHVISCLRGSKLYIIKYHNEFNIAIIKITNY